MIQTMGVGYAGSRQARYATLALLTTDKKRQGDYLSARSDVATRTAQDQGHGRVDGPGFLLIAYLSSPFDFRDCPFQLHSTTGY